MIVDATESERCRDVLLERAEVNELIESLVDAADLPLSVIIMSLGEVRSIHRVVW